MIGHRSATAGVIVAALLAGAGPLAAGNEEHASLEGDPFEGRQLFVAKLCIQCHSVLGRGGTLGPDIIRVVAGKPLPELSGEFWNHTPRMIEEMTAKGHAWPTLDRNEMSDLLSYLYYLRLFDDPGDPARGATAYERHRCGECHALGGSGGDLALPLDRYSAYTSPVPLAQAMWNEGPAMREAQTATGIPIPEFTAEEMAHLQAFIRERGLHAGHEKVTLLSIPDPTRGEAVFTAKRCAACHDSGREGAPDLGNAALRHTVAEIGGILWNHSYAMQGRMQAAGVPFPRFEDDELSNLISYLHLIGYRGGAGDATRGARLFVAKDCATCHEQQKFAAPELASSKAAGDSIALSVAMWNHAPQMHEVMAEQGFAWPKFEKGEMEDLSAYLRQISRRSNSK